MNMYGGGAMKKETRWVTYDGVDYYSPERFDWKFSKTDDSRERFKDWFSLVFEKEKQVKNGM